MALYLVPESDKKTILKFLETKHPGALLFGMKVSCAEAKALVLMTCDNKTLQQPAVKIVSFHDAQKLTCWLGIELHMNWNAVELISSDHILSKFLFYPNGNERDGGWTLCFFT